MSDLQVYNKTIWEDLPSEDTPINADNLNKIENQIEAVTNDVMANNLLTKIVYKGEVALLVDLPSANQKVGDYYIVVEKGVPYLWNGVEYKPQVVISEGGETTQSLGTLISSADTKVTPDVDDVFGYSDSEDVTNPNILKKFTWGNIRGSLATFFEGVFALVLHGHVISDVTDLQTNIDAKAPIANPIFTGVPLAPNPIKTTDTAQLATTSFVQDRVKQIDVSAVKSASFTLALVDEGTHILCSSASAITVTVPTNASVALPIGTMIMIVRYGTGVVSLAPAGGVTLNSVASKRSIATQFEVASLVKIGTDNWMLFGALS